MNIDEIAKETSATLDPTPKPRMFKVSAKELSEGRLPLDREPEGGLQVGSFSDPRIGTEFIPSYKSIFRKH